MITDKQASVGRIIIRELLESVGELRGVQDLQNAWEAAVDVSNSFVEAVDTWIAIAGPHLEAAVVEFLLDRPQRPGAVEPILTNPFALGFSTAIDSSRVIPLSRAAMVCRLISVINVMTVRGIIEDFGVWIPDPFSIDEINTRLGNLLAANSLGLSTALLAGSLSQDNPFRKEICEGRIKRVRTNFE